MASGSTADRGWVNSTGDASHWPASILLAQEAYVAVSRNETTATAKSRANHTVEVTFWIADPPAVSFYTFHCFKPPPMSDSDSDSEDAGDFEVQQDVVGAEGRFVLVRTFFASGDYEYELFIYKGDPKSPSLESVPLPDDNRLQGVSDFGIVPRGDGDQYLLVALCDAVTMKDYRLHIYSSEDRKWRTKELLNPCHGAYTIAPYKVMLLRDGVLVWLDFLRGMLVCDVLREPLHACYIPLPEPLPGNREEILKQSIPERGVMRYRDVACINGLIKFVEMELRVIVKTVEDVPPEKPSDPRNKDVLYDSDLITLYNRKHVDNKPKTLRSANGWCAMTWTRELGSDCWLKGSIVDVDDILVDDSALSALQRNESAGSSTFQSMYSACPILSTDGDDILYLKSSMKLTGPYRWVVAVDLAEKTLKVEAPEAHPFGRYSPSRQRFLPCALVNHLKRTPGIKVSAIQIAQMGSSANEPNNTAISVGEPDSYESENKRPRLLAEKVNHARDGAQSTVQNVLSSLARPDQSNMPPQLCFNRWEEPGYGGHSSCAPQNSSPLPQYFNKSTGPCNPVYAPSAPSPDIHSFRNYQSLWQQPLLPEQHTAPSRAFRPRVPLPQCFNKSTGTCNPVYAPTTPASNIYSYNNYQSLWQQPLLTEQQTTSSRAFGPHVAPHPYLNNWWGAGHHGNSQQHPAGNSYFYGAHSDSGNQRFGYRPFYHDYQC
uniref:Uncharacterized protein n=1 Tax=Avena sativa TaxID=4498 RepID=A0ACD5TN03_AVESA